MADSLELLRSVSYFADLDLQDLENIGRSLLKRSLAKGEVLFVEGEPCQGLYMVESGLARIFKTSPEGREQVLLIAGPGDAFNEVPLFDGGPNPASALALVPTVVYIVPKSDLLDLIGHNPAVASSILRVFAGRLRHLTMLVEDLSFRHVGNRLARVLLQSAGVGGEAEATELQSRLTQQEMAAMVGTARQVISRSLKTLEEEGVIRRRGRRILILKPGVLKEMI